MTRKINVRAWWLVMVAAAGSMFAVPIQAQLICGVSATGGEPQGGGSATATGSINNFACGDFANASGALGSANTAIGQTADARGDFSFNTAVGRSNARGNSSVNTASGEAADAHGDQSANTATGAIADAHGNTSNNTATGINARAFGDNSSNVAMGLSADAHGNGTSNTAVGANSLAANNSAAFGAGAQAAFVNSAAFGVGAKATRANQQVFGTATNTYTMPGLTSAASKAAQSGPTQVVTTDAFGNLGTTAPSTLGLASGADLSALTRQVRKSYTGISMAFALAGVPTLLPGKKFALSANWGTFENENGAALSGVMRVYRDMQLNASFAYGFRDNVPGGRIGVSYQW
ncbi:MAG TPA: YadA-like family protein [Candidatus Angelobacter sp.]|nr:YadA-like family protein [Candidatus Angelobacter sp.]